MQTIKYLASKYLFSKVVWHQPETQNIEDAFASGMLAAQRWIPVEDELPMCYETGKWDGFRSNFCLVKLKDSSVEVARVYRGRKNGFDFCRWRDKLEYEFKDAIITHWRPIEYPLL